MVRLAVILLVVANLLLLVMDASRKTPPEEPAIAVPAGEPEDVNLPLIRLLSELGDSAPAQVRTVECFTVGPFTDQAALASAETGLAALAESLALRETVAEVERGYWVYLPPRTDYDEANSFALTMQDAGILDVNVVSDGEWDNSVSLGYFINEANATARRDAARRLGFQVETRVQRDTETRYWLDYAQATGSLYAAQVLSDTIEPGLHRAIPCATLEQGDSP